MNEWIGGNMRNWNWIVMLGGILVISLLLGCAASRNSDIWREDKIENDDDMDYLQYLDEPEEIESTSEIEEQMYNLLDSLEDVPAADEAAEISNSSLAIDDDPYGEKVDQPKYVIVVIDDKEFTSHFSCDSVANRWDDVAKVDVYFLYDKAGKRIARIPVTKGYRIFINNYDETDWKNYEVWDPSWKK